MTYFFDIKKNFKLKHYINYIAVVAFTLLFVGLYLAGGLKASTCNTLTRMGYSILLAVSLNMVVGFLGELSLGHAGFMCIGAYVGVYLSNSIYSGKGSRIPVLIVSMLVGGLVAALFGLIVGLPALRLKGDYLAIVTLAFGEIVRNLCKNLPFFGGAAGLKNLHIYGKDLFIVALVMVFLMLIVFQNLIRSKHGRAVTAIRDNEIAAKAMGVNVTFYKLLIFTISAFFAGVAGVIYGSCTTPILYSTFSYNYSIEILVMVVLGSIGSINGSILSAVFITFINVTLTSKLSGDTAAFKNLIYALILITVVIVSNAPALSNLRKRLALVKTKVLDYFAGKKRTKEEIIHDDSAAWDRIPTKIKMDELLSTDLKIADSDPDRPDSGRDKR